MVFAYTIIMRYIPGSNCIPLVAVERSHTQTQTQRLWKRGFDAISADILHVHMLYSMKMELQIREDAY